MHTASVSHAWLSTKAGREGQPAAAKAELTQLAATPAHSIPEKHVVSVHGRL